MMPSLRAIGLLACALLLSPAIAQQQSSSSSTTTSDITVLSGTKSLSSATPTTPTGSYQTNTSKSTLASSDSGSTVVTSNATSSTSTDSTTVITGSAKTSTTLSGNGTATVTSSSPPEPINTTPCNNHPEFCSRRYSNITMVAAHNSPFVRPGSAAANQEFPVTTQLNDGIRLVQGQIRWPANNTFGEPHFCHTSCDLFDAGPITNWLTEVKNWVASHPYDVVTILLGNGNYSSPDKYVPYIERTGILQYVFTPPVVPMNLTDWPTLSQMILRGQRVVFFLDYSANQTAYPWLMDEFSHMWETPFDPVDPTFPCTIQRPPDLPPDQANARLYMVNHNLNAEVSLLGTTLLVPAVSLLNTTNAANGTGSLGVSAEQCKADWGRPPNFLNVDYYNFGTPPGSVFEVAARMNNVTYDRPCCGGIGVSGALSRRWGDRELRITAFLLGFVIAFVTL